MVDGTPHPALAPLRQRLAEEEAAYAEALAALDRLARFALPDESRPELHGALAEANAAVAAAPAAGAGLGALARRQLLDLLQPVFERQGRLEGALVRLLNAQLEAQHGTNAALRELASGLVRYAQRVEPLVDARDALRVAEAPSDAGLVLAAYERRIQEVEKRSEALLALRDRVELLTEELRTLRTVLPAGPEPEGPSSRQPAPAPARQTVVRQAVADSVYTAFENRFRGAREEIRARQEKDAALFRGREPVLDLGCGRGEFLDLLGAEGIAARGVETNASAVRECRARGLDVIEGDLVEALRSTPVGSLGGVFAAQVVEHLPPTALAALLSAAHTALRPGGLMLLETVNASSALAFLDVFIRDLTHERPLHPETLRFLAAAAGFSEVRIELRSPVPDEVRLALMPSGVLSPPVTKILNENAERLNALLFAPIDYALVANR